MKIKRGGKTHIDPESVPDEGLGRTPEEPPAEWEEGAGVVDERVLGFFVVGSTKLSLGDSQRSGRKMLGLGEKYVGEW